MHQSEEPAVAAARSVRVAAARLTGETLAAVAYVGTLTPDEPDAHIHEVDQGVQLRTGSGLVALIRWFSPGFGTGLEILLGDDATSAAGHTRARDVSGERRWAALRGRPVTGFAAGWATQDAGLPPAPWSVRLDFGPDPVVIAMGEKVEGRPTFSATSLLVFFAETDARAYTTLAGLDPAWGEPVRTD